MSKQFLDFIVCISRMRCLLCYSMKGLVIRLNKTSKLNENEEENLKKERNDSNRRRKAHGERIRSNPKKKIPTTEYYFVLFV